MSAYELTGPILADEDRTVGKAWVVGGRITYERPRHADTVRVDGWVIPGLVDMHCHLAVGPSGPVDGELVVKQALTERDAGVLMVRDTGSATSLDILDGRGDLPKVYRSGRFIARPKRYLKDYAVEVEPAALADEAARQARASGSWVKIIADWIDRDLGEAADLTPLWSAAQLADAVAAVHTEGARVTAHTFATESLDALLDAGFDCIEHGTGMTDAHLERAAGAGTPVVPTLLQIGNFASFAAQAGDRFPLFAERMQRMYDRRHEHVTKMWEAGVTLLVGTDAGTSIAHGDLAREAAELARCIPAADVVAGATWRARRFLGAPVLAEGDPADLVVLDRDPREEIGVLVAPRAVMLDGVRVI
ncbi:amidohydrolase family protein [Demequina sp. TTPB684]|uniref:amidohydrolase family protein n=1 Tax=unclassified Demequina TaxID=2620311 RepID=UPI001CF3C57B|nr:MULTISPECIES: amidohydrolase family protein [unclassified Demequina]MCB2413173.1 amidohydrolase family protein [Demequina sp. TTPB684]UPU89679.1 amidohydrolase family protein [Demequina sp. TMPB413]